MHAMLIDTQSHRLEQMQIAFLEAGIHVTGSGSLEVADCCLRRACVDILLVEETAGDVHLAEIVALAERRNPRLVTILLTDDVAMATDRLADRLASLHCVLGGDADPGMVARMARASLSGRALCRVTGSAPAQHTAAPVAPAVARTEPPQPVFFSSRRGAALQVERLSA